MEAEEKIEQQESDLMRVQREHYEKLLADKDKIIKDLIENGTKQAKAPKPAQDADVEEDEEEAKKKDEEERRKKRFEYYKKYIH